MFSLNATHGSQSLFLGVWLWSAVPEKGLSHSLSGDIVSNRQNLQAASCDV